MQIRHSLAVQCQMAALIAALISPVGAGAQEASFGKLFSDLDRPAIFERGINKRPLEKVLQELSWKNNLEFRD